MSDDLKALAERVLELGAAATPGPLKAAQADIEDEDDSRWSVLTDGKQEYFVATIENGAPGDTLEDDPH